MWGSIRDEDLPCRAEFHNSRGGRCLHPAGVFSNVCVMLYTTNISKIMLLIGRRASPGDVMQCYCRERLLLEPPSAARNNVTSRGSLGLG